MAAPFLLVANWKSKQTFEGVQAFVEGIREHSFPKGIKVVICPSFSLLALSQWARTNITLGAQDVSRFPKGAFTGEVPAADLKDLGVEYCLVGHSERRRHFGENSQIIIEKLQQCLGAEITPIVCLGNLDELYELDPLRAHFSEMVFCYEPVDFVSEDGEFREINLDLIDVKIREFKTILGQGAKIIYGGSVNSENAGEIAALTSVGGFLVGQASLKYQDLISLTYDLKP